jgi:hypothetical protein
MITTVLQVKILHTAFLLMKSTQLLLLGSNEPTLVYLENSTQSPLVIAITLLSTTF